MPTKGPRGHTGRPTWKHSRPHRAFETACGLCAGPRDAGCPPGPSCPWDCCGPWFWVTALAYCHRAPPLLADSVFNTGLPLWPPAPCVYSQKVRQGPCALWGFCGLRFEALDASSPREAAAGGHAGPSPGQVTWRSVTGAGPGWATAAPEVPARPPALHPHLPAG